MMKFPSFVPRFARRHLIISAALALLLLQLAHEWLWLSPRQEERDRLALSVQRRLRTPMSDTLVEPVPLQRIQYYAKVLKELPDEAERLVTWHALATKHAVRIKSVNYKDSSESLGVNKTLMQAEMEASYPAVRLFIRDVLHHDLATGLESMNISHATGNAALLKVQLQFVMYAHAESSTPHDRTH